MDLNDEQQRAVELEHSPTHNYAVTAGPGSGKTRVLVARALWYLQRYRSDEILLVTFTRAAAEEMERRLHAELRERGTIPAVPRCTTIHGWCARFLAGYTDRYREGMTVYDDLDQERVLRQVARDLGMPRADGARIETLRNDRYVRRAYQQRLAAARAVDFDGLEVQALEELRAPFGVDLPYKAILVDEAQDLSMREWHLLKQMRLCASTSRTTDLYVVGDRNQAIYEWRDAWPQGFDDFYMQDCTKRAELRSNYRSEPGIVSLCNHWMDTHTRPERDPVPDYGVYATWARPEAERVAEVVRDTIDEGRQPEHIAVLARTWRELYQVRSRLAEFDVPAVVCNPRRSAWDTREGRVVAAMLRLVRNPADDELAAFVAREVGIGPVTIKRWRVDAKKTRSRLVDQWESAGRTHYMKRVLDTAWESEDNASLAMLVAAHTVGALDTLEHATDQFLRALGLLPARWHSLEAWHRWFTFGRSVQAKVLDRYADHVHLLTMHGSKGLEFPVVVVKGHHLEVATDEARRLLYVAMSRAEDRLVITSDYYDDRGVPEGMKAVIEAMTHGRSRLPPRAHPQDPGVQT